MDQSTNNHTTGLVTGLLFLSLSLPAPWILMEHPTMELFDHGPFSPITGPLTVTGLKGFLTIAGMRLPVWLVVVLGLVSVFARLLNQRRITSVPGICFWVPWIVSFIYVLTAMALGIFAADAHLRSGPVLALIGLILASTFGLPAAKKISRPIVGLH